MADSLSPDALRILVDHQKTFFAFLRRRLGSDAAADEVLQAAFLRGIERGGSLRDDENVIAWFYRLLRNAVGEHYRRRAAEDRALEKFAREQLADDPELEAAVCACVASSVETLKPEYAEMIRQVDLASRPIGAVAQGLGISANNAAVRLHRARRALGQAIEEACGICCRSGCFDCECELPPGPL